MHSVEFTFTVLTVNGERILNICGVYVPSNKMNMQDTGSCIYTVIIFLLYFLFLHFM